MSEQESSAHHMIPVFIGGSGRSGTTILHQVLAAHSRVVAARHEMRLLTDPGGALDLIDRLSDHWSPYHADRALHDFAALARACERSGIVLKGLNKVLRRLGASPPRYAIVDHGTFFGIPAYRQQLSALIGALTYGTSVGSWFGSPPLRWRSIIYETEPRPRAEIEPSVAAFFDNLYRGKAAAGQTHWTDSTPQNLLYAPELFALFPDARLIHITRDPRDVTASYRRAPWGGDDCVTIARRLHTLFQRWWSIQNTLPNARYLEISLESLVDDPVGGVARILSFIGLPFEESLPVYQLDRAKSNQQRWKSEIPSAEWPAISDWLAPIIARYEYSD